MMPSGGWERIPDPFENEEQDGEPGQEKRPVPPQKDYAGTIAVLIAAHGETRTAEALRSAFLNAHDPSRVVVGVVQQNDPEDSDTLEELCALLGTPLELRPEFVRAEIHRRQDDEDPWGHTRYTAESLSSCKFAPQVRMYRMGKDEAAGSQHARSFQTKLLGSGNATEDFCLQVDAHTKFLKNWDRQLLNDWKATANEFAMLTTSPVDVRMLPNININSHWEMPHLVNAELGPSPFVFHGNNGNVANLDKPVLSKLYSSRMHFSRCHAETDVPNDPRLRLDSEVAGRAADFLRGVRLWTNGYDFYTPTKPSILAYYDEDRQDPAKVESVEAKKNMVKRAKEKRARDAKKASSAPQAAPTLTLVQHNGHAMLEKADSKTEAEERVHLQRRVETLLRFGNASPAKADLEMLGAYDLGKRRSLQDYIELTGIDTIKWEKHFRPPYVEKWTPWHEGQAALVQVQ